HYQQLSDQPTGSSSQHNSSTAKPGKGSGDDGKWKSPVDSKGKIQLQAD
ncbi:hypothetical protein A6R68_02679, partial [Neotoma lepida]